jgi:hypothetical protein
MPAMQSGAAVLKTELHLVYVLLFVVLCIQRSAHAIVKVWPYSQNFWSQKLPAIGRWAYQTKKEEEEQINVVLFVNEN